MMAINYGNLEIFKFFLDSKASLNDQDIYQFSPLLYSVRGGNMPMFFYLLYMGADLYTLDKNNSSVAHWAAYKNNLFIL